MAWTCLMFQGGHGGYGGGHGGSGTACIVKGSYCQCHYCKCEKGQLHCQKKGLGFNKGFGKILALFPPGGSDWLLV